MRAARLRPSCGALARLERVIILSTCGVGGARFFLPHSTDPLAVSPADIPSELVEKEREIYKAQSEDSGKPPEIIEKMVEGKVSKFLAEVSLTEQDFVKDPNTKINQLLKENSASILNFTRFEVGEGIEVEKVDFATEVMSQIEG